MTLRNATHRVLAGSCVDIALSDGAAAACAKQHVTRIGGDAYPPILAQSLPTVRGPPLGQLLGYRSSYFADAAAVRYVVHVTNSFSIRKR